MSAVQEEDTQKTLHQDSSVCFGDGTTCVECGKVFTHPFYFSTHINSHTSEKAFVVIGQCALCGLVFSDADIFAAHLSSSQTRLENQVAPPKEENVSAEGDSDVKSKVASRVASAMKKQSTEIKLEMIDQEDIKEENHSPQPNKTKPSPTNVTDSNEEARGKRKRKAPQRFEIDTGPQLASSRVAVSADPEVEAYLLSLKQMGLTVDPEAFSSGAKRRRKTSEGSGGKGRGRKEFIVIDDGYSDVTFQQKPSPKYEYLDSDDSFDEEPEILPESGKMTRGQRLQQRQERLSQGKGSVVDTKPDIVKLEVTSNPENNKQEKDTSSAVDIEKQKETVPQPKSNPNTTAVKRVLSTSAASPAIKKEKPTVAAPYFAGSVGRGSQLSYPRGRGRGALAQPNIGKLNTVRANHAPPFAGRNNQYRAFSMPNTGSSNIYQPRSAVASNSGPRPSRFPQGQMKERADTGKSPSLINLPKSENLEDLKKNSRDNVEMMLQSVGMIAVTSSAMGQGKIFGSEKGSVFPPVKKMEATNVRQPGHPYGGFMSKPFSSLKSLPSQQSGSHRGQARFGAGPRGRVPAHPQPYRGNPAFQLPHGQGFGVGLQRGSGQQFSSGMRGSIRGRGSNSATIGGQVSGNSMVRGSMRGRGSNPAPRGGVHSGNSMVRGRGSNPAARGGLVSANSMVRGSVRGRGSNLPARGNVNSVRPMASSRGGAGLVSKQIKPAHASGDVIVIVDDDDIQESAAGPSGGGSAGSGHARTSKSPKSSIARGSKGEVTILDVDMDSLNSDIKIIEDKTQELSSPSGSVDLQNTASVEQPPHDDIDNDDDVEIKPESEDKIADSPKVECEPLQADADVQSTSGVDRITDEVDIRPGEDIDGWKVCLAEDSDSNDDSPSPQPSTSKAPASKDLHLSLAGSPEPGCSSTQPAGPASEDLAPKPSPHKPVSDLSQKVEQNESQPQAAAAESTAVSATEELDIKQAKSESHNEAEDNAVSERLCHEKQDIGNEDIKPITVSDQEFVPHSSNQSPKKVDTKSESPGFGASAFQEDGNGACFEDVLQDFKNKSSPSVSSTDTKVGVYAEGADQSMQTATTADTVAVLTTPVSGTATEDQNQPSILKCNGDISVGLSLDDAVVSDETSYNSPVALSLDDAGILYKDTSYNSSVSPDDAGLSREETNYNSSLALSLDAVLLDKERGFIVADVSPTDCETAVEESSLTNTDFETSPDTTLADSGILVADLVPDLSCTHTSNGSFSDNTEVDAVVPPLESDLNLVNDSTQSHVINSKSDSETAAGNASVLASSSSALAPENSIDSANNTFLSPSASHACPVTGADILRDDSNLLDIFTEIEKTCKEMEQTLDSETDKKTVVLAEKFDVSRVVSDLSEDLGIVKEEPDFKEELKLDRNNGVAFSESRTDGAVKESRSGDCRYSDMIYEKEATDNVNVSGIDEEHNKSKHVEKDVAEDECGM